MEAQLFASLDAFRGFWRFRLYTDTQEIYSLLSDIEIFTLTRLVQASTDAARGFQSGMLKASGELVYQSVLIWIDDILVFDFQAFLGSLTQVFVRLRNFNNKLNPRKSDVFSRSITWCGRRIDKNEISYEEDFIGGLLDLLTPSNEAELQKLFGAVNWMRTLTPELAKETFLLKEWLKAAQVTMKSAKASKLAGFTFTSDQWNTEIDSAFSNVKAAICESIQIWVNNENLVWISDNNELRLWISIVKIQDLLEAGKLTLHSRLSKLSVGGLIWKNTFGNSLSHTYIVKSMQIV